MANTIIFIFIIIIIILDIITMGFIHNLIIKFFKALPLFIDDIRKRDKGVFRGYGFWAFSGLRWFWKDFIYCKLFIKNT